MAVVDHFSHAGAGTPSVFTVIGEQLRGFRGMVETRVARARTISALSSLSDRQLEDIGIVRGQITEFAGAGRRF